MALKLINKINLRLKFLHRKNKFLTPALGRLLCNAIIQPHFDFDYQYYLLVYTVLFTSCFTIFNVSTNSLLLFFQIFKLFSNYFQIISNFLETTMKIRHLLVLCYPRHIVFVFNCLRFISLSSLTIVVN